MNYAVAIISGLLLGIAVAAAKHYFLWRPYAQGKSDNVYGRMAISFGANVLMLLGIFLLRGWWPYSFNFTIASAAIGLSAASGIISYLANKKAVASANK